MSIEIPELVRRHAAWSNSKADVASRCSLQYDFKYGSQKRKELVPFRGSRVGTAAHLALQFVLTGVSLKNAIQRAIAENGLTSGEVEDLRAFEERITHFYERITAFKRANNVTKTFVEVKWGLRADFTPARFFDDDVFFRGVLDFAMLIDDAQLVIIDHKSGKKKDIEEHQHQINSYLVLAQVNIPTLRSGQGAIHYLSDGAIDWDPRKTISVEHVQEHLRPWLINHLSRSCAQLGAPPAPTEGWWCGWCGYKPICPRFTPDAASRKTE